MAYVYRSVRVVLQNSTDDRLTVEGTEVLVGAWSNGAAVDSGDVLAPQSALAMGTESTVVGRGTQGYARFGSLSGYTQIAWSQPWVGSFAIEVDLPRNGELRAEIQINDEDPSNIAALVTLSPQKRRSGA